MRVQMIAAAVLVASLPAFAATKPKHPSSTNASVRHASSRKAAAHAAVPGMAPERATEIQQALIQHGYMSGTPSGEWDAQSQAAMQKLQADNGWQTKFTPDSRALIALGLGSTATSAAQ